MTAPPSTASRLLLLVAVRDAYSIELCKESRKPFLGACSRPGKTLHRDVPESGKFGCGIFFLTAVVFLTVEVGQLRKHLEYGSDVLHGLQDAYEVIAKDDLLEFRGDARPANYLQAVGMPLHRRHHLIGYLPAVTRGETQGTQYTDGVVAIRLVGVHRSVDTVGLYVGNASAGKVEHLSCGYVLVKRIDGEVAAKAVVHDGAEAYLGVAAVGVRILLSACLHYLYLMLRKGFEPQLGSAEAPEERRRFECKSFMLEPGGKHHASVGHGHGEIHVVNLPAHDGIAATSPYGIYVALPRCAFDYTVEVIADLVVVLYRHLSRGLFL